jgi:CRISPR-associated protein Csc3
MNPEAARKAHETLVGNTDLYSNIIDAAGEYDAKVDSTANSSLAAHILNAVTIGVNAFVYEAVGPDEDLFADYGEDVKVLAAALALHDTDKFVREAHGADVDGNSDKAFDWYFDPAPDADGNPREADPFGIEEFLGEDYREDLQYLVQRTETREDSSSTRGYGTEFRGLERYCRIGDSTASVALREGSEGVFDQLTTLVGSNHVHRLEFTQLEQPILNDTLLGTTKEVITGEATPEQSGVIIGSSPDSVVYLGEPVERSEIKRSVAERAPKRISADFEFECKLNWNSFDYDVLSEVGISVEEKEQKIANAFRSLLDRGSAGVESFEHIPESFEPYFPILAKAIYIDGMSDFADEDVQEAYDRILEEQGVMKIKLHFVAYLLENRDEHAEFLQKLAEKMRPKLREDLEPESDAIGTVVDRFFDGRVAPELGSKCEMCFLCGAETDTKYQKGHSAVYRTQEFSRRVPPHAKYKSICEVCNLEYALLSFLCEESGVSTNNAVEIAYFYFDDFVGDVRTRAGRVGNLVQGDADELDDAEMRASLVEPQYFLQPIYILDKNHRMAVIRQVMQAAQESGMKVVVGRPFTRFESADAVFTDEEATRPQELLGLEEAERFGPLPPFIENDRTDSHLRRALQLFKIMSMVGQDANMSNPYLQLDRDTFHSIADFAVVNHDNAIRLPDIREYFEAYHEEALMDMKTIAERGIDLFGEQYDSKYKKTKIFREALHAFLSGKNQQMNDERLVEYVESQVYAAADREDYAGRATPEQAEAFVEAIREYLVENDLYDLKKLSDWEDALVNSYYYAYDQTLIQ